MDRSNTAIFSTLDFPKDTKNLLQVLSALERIKKISNCKCYLLSNFLSYTAEVLAKTRGVEALAIHSLYKGKETWQNAYKIFQSKYAIYLTKEMFCLENPLIDTFVFSLAAINIPPEEEYFEDLIYLDLQKLREGNKEIKKLPWTKEAIIQNNEQITQDTIFLKNSY